VLPELMQTGPKKKKNRGAIVSMSGCTAKTFLLKSYTCTNIRGVIQDINNVIITDKNMAIDKLIVSLSYEGRSASGTSNDIVFCCDISQVFDLA
jgi:hypothetical protein